MDDHLAGSPAKINSQGRHYSDFGGPPVNKNNGLQPPIPPIRREISQKTPSVVEVGLGSLSHFMKHLKQPIARRANKEDGCDGHFFEQRFYSGALLNEQAMLAAMAYVDLNPVRARLARRLEQCRDASVRARLRENSAAALAAYLRPLASGLARPTPPRLGVTLADYLDLLREMAVASDGRAAQPDDRIARWIARTATLRKRQRAYGPIESLRQWTDQRGFQLREVPLPN